MINIGSLRATEDRVLILPDEEYHKTMGSGRIVTSDVWKRETDRGTVLSTMSLLVITGQYVIFAPGSAKIVETDEGPVFSVHESDLLATVD